jgi:hypothetical protein
MVNNGRLTSVVCAGTGLEWIAWVGPLSRVCKAVNDAMAEFGPKIALTRARHTRI